MITLIQISSLLTGTAGLILSLSATYKLFKQMIGLKELKILDDFKQKELKPDDLYRDLAKRINDEIKDSL